MPPAPAPAPKPAPQPKPSPAHAAKVKSWATGVTLGAEYGGGGAVVTRFVGPITLSVIRGGTVGPLAHVVHSLDAELRTVGSSLTQLPDGNTNAHIEVYYVPYAEFEAIGQSNSFPVYAGNYGYFWARWTPQYRIYKGYVLLARDKLFGTALRHFTFEEVTQVLGIMNDSATFSDSVFFAKGSNGGNAQTLSELDRRLLRFLYRNVQPGFGPSAFSAAFDAHFWAAP